MGSKCVPGASGRDKDGRGFLNEEKGGNDSKICVEMSEEWSEGCKGRNGEHTLRWRGLWERRT